MQSNYSINYIKNLLTQALATITGLLSLFIVVPFLTQDKVLYGIYSICMSLTIFINYADLGFFSTGQKFSAECYAKNDIDGEQRIVGFTTFTVLCFSILVSLCLIPLAVRPDLLITNVQDNSIVARQLITILICSVPFMIIKRIASLVFTIRVEQYKYNIIVLIAQLVKIISILYFFGDNRYYLVEYYLFSQVIDLLSTFLLTMYMSVKYSYGLDALKCIRFNKVTWNIVKNMAFVSLFTSITWILYYELDLLALAKISTPATIALYSTAFTLLTLSRNYFGIIYNSFSARYNHYYGLGDSVKLKEFFSKNIYILFPFVFYPILIFTMLGSYFVTSWAGDEFEYSGTIARVLILGGVLTSFSYPSSQYLYSAGKVKTLYWISCLLPFVFWIGIVSTYSLLGILSFALFKSIAQIISATYSFIKACKFQMLNIRIIINKLIKSYSIPTLIIIICCYFSTNYMHSNKCMYNLVMNISIMFIIFLLGVIISFFTSKCLYEYSVLFIKKLLR